MTNQKQILKFQIFSIIFTMVLGTLLHFTYEWSNYNPFVAAFSSTNHSCNDFIAFVVLITLFLSFIFFTYFPPHIGYFQDPVTNQYGIVRRS